ncbi:MAG TPA: hypothetical protein VGC91_18405 [Pyrinomonadaceae bacterium]|jgi:hypothetical protein
MRRICSGLSFIPFALILAASSVAAQQPAASPAEPQPKAPALEEWRDDFDGASLDQARWERFTFEGGSGGKLEVKEGQLQMRGMSGSRAGVRSKQQFTGDRFIVEGTIAKVGQALPEPNSNGLPIGNAILTVMFDGSGRNRIEWLLTSEGTFEAWSVVNGKGERLDDHKLGTKVTAPTISIARKGDDFYFVLNGEIGLQKTIKNMPRTFHVMLYGYGSSENNWDSVRVVTPK